MHRHGGGLCGIAQLPAVDGDGEADGLPLRLVGDGKGIGLLRRGLAVDDAGGKIQRGIRCFRYGNVPRRGVVRCLSAGAAAVIRDVQQVADAVPPVRGRGVAVHGGRVRRGGIVRLRAFRCVRLIRRRLVLRDLRVVGAVHGRHAVAVVQHLPG